MGKPLRLSMGIQTSECWLRHGILFEPFIYIACEMNLHFIWKDHPLIGEEKGIVLKDVSHILHFLLSDDSNALWWIFFNFQQLLITSLLFGPFICYLHCPLMDFVLWIGLLQPVFSEGQIYLSLQLWYLSVCILVQLWTKTALNKLSCIRNMSVFISENLFSLAHQILALLEGLGLTDKQW